MGQEYMLKVYFFVMGMTSLVPIYAIIALSDYFNDQFPDYDFYFYSLLPTTIAIPFAFLLFLGVQGIGINTIVSVSSVFTVVLSCCVPLIPIFGNGNFWEFIGLLGLYSVATVFQYTF